MATLLGDCVVVDHRVHVARRDEEAQPRLTQNGNGGWIAPIGLGDNADAIAVGFEQTGDDCGPEGRMVDIGVAAHVDEVKLIPTALAHIGAGHG